jgi:hypothetical protein
MHFFQNGKLIKEVNTTICHHTSQRFLVFLVWETLGQSLAVIQYISMAWFLSIFLEDAFWFLFEKCTNVT